VSATDKATGKSQQIEITGSSGLSNEEIDRMKREAEEHESDDRERRELVDLKNQADSLVYSTKKSLEEHGSRISSETRAGIESAISNLEDKLKSDDNAAIQAALKQLNDASIELGKAVYEAASSEVGPDKSDQSRPDEDVIDAEYEVKDDT
jgi:molecular chaperone DnaK